MLKQKAPAVSSAPNIIPLADVMLVLLIIFMVITPMLSRGITVDLAMTDNPVAMEDADREDAIIVAVSRDGRVYIGSDRVAIENLTSNLNDLIGVNTDQTIYLKSDSRARYEGVVEAVDAIRETGADEVGLLTEKRGGEDISSTSTGTM